MCILTQKISGFGLTNAQNITEPLETKQAAPPDSSPISQPATDFFSARSSRQASFYDFFLRTK